MELLLNLNWLAVGQIVLIDVLLGGDNAIVIALACRNLSPGLRIKGILWGTVGAVVIRILLVAFAVNLLQLPYLKIVGAILLFWIGVKLLAESDSGHDDVHASERVLAAVKTIIVADLVMSIDNVVAVAGAAEEAAGGHELMLVVFGILVSIPIIIWGSTMILKLMERLPAIGVAGSALLGYLAGEMAPTDPALHSWAGSGLLMSIPGTTWHISGTGLLCAALVVVLGRALAGRTAAG